MKKKFILLPITLTALTPMASMVGCANPDEPEPEDLEKYKVTTQEMENAISLKGVEYLQGQGRGEGDRGYGHLTMTDDFQCAPLIYYNLEATTGPGSVYSYDEKYIEPDTVPKTYKKTYRTSPTGQWQAGTASEDEYIKIESLGKEFTDHYQLVKGYGGEFNFVEDKKSYWGSAEYMGEKVTVGFYFENKIMVKMYMKFGSGTIYEQMTTTFTYDEVTPIPPPVPVGI